MRPVILASVLELAGCATQPICLPMEPFTPDQQRAVANELLNAGLATDRSETTKQIDAYLKLRAANAAACSKTN